MPRVAVCEAPAVLGPGSDDWRDLAEQSRALEPEIFAINEMPFGSWIAKSADVERERLLASHEAHDRGLRCLGDLGAPVVLGTRATFEDGRSVNQAFYRDRSGGVAAVHTKQFFPDEAGFYEARWFERGRLRFRTAEVGGLRVAFLICTDVMFLEWARFYGRDGAHLIAVPRATPLESLERWRTVMAAAAFVSGCYVATSNRVGRDGGDGPDFGGRGWVFDPSGAVIAETSRQEPVVATEVDPAIAEAAKLEYPRYVRELPDPAGEADLSRPVP